MIRAVCVVIVLLLSCIEGPAGLSGPEGPKGPKGDSLSYYQKDAYFQLTADNWRTKYDTTGNEWVVLAYGYIDIKNIDSCIIQVMIRKGANYYWFEPSFGYGYTYRDMWQIKIPDETKKYAGYEGKIVVIGK